MKTKRGKELSTEARIEQYEGKLALLKSWEQQPDHVQIQEHDYLVDLRSKVRLVANYITHRADPKAIL
jgi:hypothetical protein